MKQIHLTIIMLLWTVIGFAQTSYYVSSSGVNNDVDRDGLSISEAWATVSYAVARASSGDTIIIDGTINHNEGQVNLGISLTFQGQSNAVVDGSSNSGRFLNVLAGTATSISFNDITFQNFTNTVQGAVMNHSSDADAIVFNFTNCNFLNNSTSNDNGGGALYFGQSPNINITGCTFYNNAVVTSTAPNARGGAINFFANSTATITSSTFYQNKIAKTGNFDGAAIRVNNNECNISISNSLFYDNKASNGSGANSDFNGVPGATMSFTNSLAEYINNVDTTTGSDITADFTNTTFTFVSPNLTYGAPSSISDDTPIDFGSDNNDVGAWDSKINLFKGTSDSDWATGTNWSSTSAPLSDENVTMLSDSPAAVIGSSTNATINNLSVDGSSSLTINSGGTLIVNGSSTGNVTYNRNLGTTNWYLVSSPFGGEDMTDMRGNNSFANGTGGSRIGFAAYTTNDDSWSYFTTSSADALGSGVGYSAKLSASGNLSFTGTVNTSDSGVDVALSNSGNRFNLLGNPYSSYINSATFLNNESAISDTQNIWVWNQSLGSNGEYEVIDATDDFVLAPTQGFFVKANAAGGTFNFSEANQTTTGNAFQKQASLTSIKLWISDGDAKNYMRLRYMDNASNSFDVGKDGELFGGSTNNFSIYSELIANNQGKKYQLQSLPNSDFENMVVPVGVIASAGKQITFSAETMNLPTGLKVFLEDRENNTFTRLDEANNEYQVTLNQDLNDIGRFYLHTTSSALSTPEVNLQNVSIYATNTNNLRIVGISQGKANVKVFNILGKQVLDSNFTSTGVSDIALPKLSTGVYVVQLTSEQGSLNKKIILE